MAYDLETIASLLQPMEEIGGPEGPAYVATMTAIAREAMRRACVASGRSVLVATFDVTGLTSDEVGALGSYVEAQSEGSDDGDPDGCGTYPEVPVTVVTLP